MGSQAWNRKNSILIALRFVNNSGIPQALRAMTDNTGEKDTEYIRRVVTESLKRDGFLPEKAKED